MVALLFAGAFSLAFTLFLTPLFIKLFHRLQWGQFIRDDGPQTHHTKRGTATMGGIVIILASVLGYFVGHLLTWDGIRFDPVTTMKRPPIRTSSSSVRLRIARAASAPPRPSDPVSPRKICAGEVFHQRNPMRPPQMQAATTARSSGSATW